METIRITLRSSNTTIRNRLASPPPSAALIHDFRVPASGNFRQLKHDFESQERDFQPRSNKYGLGSPGPETVGFRPFHGEDFVPLTEEMQWFHFGLLAKANPALSTEELKARWRALTVNCVIWTGLSR